MRLVLLAVWSHIACPIASIHTVLEDLRLQLGRLAQVAFEGLGLDLLHSLHTDLAAVLGARLLAVYLHVLLRVVRLGFAVGLVGGGCLVVSGYAIVGDTGALKVRRSDISIALPVNICDRLLNLIQLRGVTRTLNLRRGLGQ